MYAEGERADWLQTIAAQIMDGGAMPPSLDHLNITVPPKILTRMSDGCCTAAAAFGEERRKDKEAGWRVIIGEMVTLLREQGFVGGSDQGLTWIKPLDGEWKVRMFAKTYGGEEVIMDISIFGQRERRMTCDRAVVGERHEITGERVGTPSLHEFSRGASFELLVESSRGNIKPQKFELHPLALTIPPMTETERETLRTSIERDGVKVPIEIYEKKILDGRNRSYFASVLRKPVHIKIFEGTEEEARRHVAILNLHRRHLSSAQRYLTVYNLFGEQADKDAAEAIKSAAIRGNQNRGLSPLIGDLTPVPAPLKTAGPGTKDRSGEWHARAAFMAAEAGILGITPAGMRAIREVKDAPQTLARIASGGIRTVAQANLEARAEKKLPASIRTEGVDVVSINKRLGRCIHQLNAILTDGRMPLGDQATEETLSDRAQKVIDLATRVQQLLRDRKMIS